MIQKRTIGGTLFDVVNHLILILLAIVTLYPFLYVIFASLSDPGMLAAENGILLKPVGFSVSAYEEVLKDTKIWVGYKNTLIYLVVGTTINIFMTSLGAYVTSRNNFFWKKPMNIMIMFTMFFSGGMIPTYLLIRDLEMLDTMWALVLPGAISTWNLIIMRTSFASIPSTLEEAAKIDGATELRILMVIILPLSMPVIAVMLLFYGVGHWNAWFNAMLYLDDETKKPLQLILREILLSNNTDNMMGGAAASDKEAISETLKYATTMVATIPILCVYPFLQKYFVKGVMVGAVKG